MRGRRRVRAGFRCPLFTHMLEPAPPRLCRGPELSVITALSPTHSSCHRCPRPLPPRPLEDLRVSWKRNGVTITSGLRSFGRRLTISNPTSPDSGEYVCEAALARSTSTPARARAFLSIIGNAYPVTGCHPQVVAPRHFPAHGTVTPASHQLRVSPSAWP